VVEEVAGSGILDGRDAALDVEGGGFSDDDLRQLLVRAGALRFEGSNGDELWGLRERNQDRLN
jgi:hypothetical protein